MISAVIVDDEANSRDTLAAMLEEYVQDVTVLGQANSAEAGYALIQEKSPDLVFLDIEMPGGNGFSLLERFDEVDFHVIFITAYDHYAIKAFKFSALDYLLKPLLLDDLNAALDKVRKLKGEGRSNKDNVAALFENLGAEPDKRRIVISDMQGMYITQVPEIIRCQADGNYTEFHMANGERVVASNNLKYFEDILDDNHFMRVHRTHLINLQHVSRFSKDDGGYIVMNNGDKVELSRRRRAEFLEMLGRL